MTRTESPSSTGTQLDGTLDPKPRYRRPSPPAPETTVTSVTAAAPARVFPVASTSSLPSPNPLTSASHRPIPSVREGVPAYVPLASWPRDGQPIRRIDWREGEERMKRRATARVMRPAGGAVVRAPPPRDPAVLQPGQVVEEEEGEAKVVPKTRRSPSEATGERTTGTTTTAMAAAAVASTMGVSEPSAVKVEWSLGAQQLQGQQQEQGAVTGAVAVSTTSEAGDGVEAAPVAEPSASAAVAPLPPSVVADPSQRQPQPPTALSSSSSSMGAAPDPRDEPSKRRGPGRRGPPLVPRPRELVGGRR